MRQLTLVEYRPERGVPLSRVERDVLRRLVPSLSIAPAPETDDRYDLTPGSHVGAVVIGDLAVEIRPKIAIDRLMFMLSYALGRMRWPEEAFDFALETDVFEAVALAFAGQLRGALRRGVLHGYRMEEDALQTVRGRIRFDEQLRRRFGITPPVEVRFDEFTDDIEENRLLKAAIERLGRMPICSPLTRRTLRELDAVLGNVCLVTYDSRRLPEITWTRLNERYRPAVELARLILRASSFDLGHGQVRAAAFLLDMNAVFEDFVVTALRDELRLTERDFPQGAHKRALRLDASRRIGLQPDISWWHGPTCVFVGDVKYKAVRDNAVKHHDIYQLLAYTIATGLPGGLLIYAAGEEEPRHYAISQAGKTLDVVALDLSGSPDAILRQVKGMAGQVLALREMAVGVPR